MVERDMTKWPKKEGCQCVGKVHKVLTNCLNCGLIICEYDRNEKCRYCGDRLPDEVAGTKSQRERKLTAVRYEENKITTAQTATPSITEEIVDESESLFFCKSWLNPEEQKAEEERIRKRIEEKKKELRKLVLNVDIEKGKVVYNTRTKMNQL